MSPKPNPPNNLSTRFERFGTRVNRSQFLWILTVAVLLGTAFLGVSFIQTPWQQQRRILETRHAEEIQRSDLLTVLGGLKQQIDGLEEKLLFQGGTPVLTSEVTRLATTAGLEIESVAPKEYVSLDAYRKIQIEIRATATFNNLLLFLHALETHQPVLLIGELQIERPSPSGASANPGYTPFMAGTNYQDASMPTLPPVEQLDPERQRVRIVIGAFAREADA